MPRALWLCLLIVAAIHSPLTAAGFAEAPVPQSVAAAGSTLSVDPANHARYLPEIIRLLYTPPENRSHPAKDLLRRAPRAAHRAAPGAPRVAVPLDAAEWSRAVFRRAVAEEDLIAAIVTDRRAALLAYGLAALDDHTLELVGNHPALLTRLYEESAASFAAFSGSLRTEAGHVVLPGGEHAAPLWESVVHTSPNDAAAFIAALFAQEHGRIAYLYDLVSRLDRPRASFLLGSWIEDPLRRAAAFQSLAATVAQLYSEWGVDHLPFSRPLNDLTLLALRINVDASGAPKPPAARAFWTDVFGADDPFADGAPVGERDSIDAAWLTAVIGEGDMYRRGYKLDQLGFVQRLFSTDDKEAVGAVLTATRAFPRLRMLMLTLERMGIGDPAVYAAGVAAADRLVSHPETAFWTLSQFQGTLAVLAQLVQSGSLDSRTVIPFVTSLFAVPAIDGEYRGRLAQWWTEQLLPALPRAATVEGRVIAGLAGPAEREGRTVSWEGQVYRLDFAAADARRLETVRRKQGGVTLDAALAVIEAASALRADVTPSSVDEVAATLATLTESMPAVLDSDASPAGARSSPPSRTVLSRVREELGKSGGDVGRVRRQADTLLTAGDTVLGEALLSFAYAIDLADPDAAALMARNVAFRHDFGLRRVDGASRDRGPWEEPRAEFRPGVAWHITGSALGLDLALAPHLLRRVAMETPADRPRLESNQRQAFAVNVALMNTRRLRDADMHAIAEAVSRGLARVAALKTAPGGLSAIAADLHLEPWRVRVLRDAPQGNSTGDDGFSLVELMVLGGVPEGTDLDAWGAAALPLRGCVCTAFVTPALWPLLMGRPQVTLLATSIPDLNIRVALALDALGLPAALARPVLAAAVPEFIENVNPRDAHDWWPLTETARALSRTRLEDYVAAATAVDGPLVPAATASDPVAREGDRR